MLDKKDYFAITNDDLAVLRRFYIASVARGVSMELVQPMYDLLSRLIREELFGAEAGSISASEADDPIVPTEYEAAFKVLHCMYWLTRIDAMDIIPISSGTRKSIEDALRVAMELLCLHGVAGDYHE